MGNTYTKGTIKVLILGLSSAGKSHFLYTLKYGESNGVRKTEGYNAESMIYRGYILNFVDVGGEMPPKYRARMLEDVGCMYYFVDGSFTDREDSLEKLYTARNDLLELMRSDVLCGIPVGIIHNVRRLQDNCFPARACEEYKRRPFNELLVGFSVRKLRTWATVFVSDLSYTGGETVNALLDFTIKCGKSV